MSVENTAAVRRGSHFVTSAGITFAGLMVANVLQYVFYALVSRTIGVVAYGTFAALIALVLILAAPAQIAQTVVAKLASDVAATPGRLAGLVRAIDRGALIVGVVAGALLLALSVPVATFLHVTPGLIALCAVSLCSAIALPFLRGVLQGLSAFRAFAISNVAETAAKAIAAPLLGLVAGVTGALGGLALAYAAALAYTFVAATPHRRGEHVRFSLRTVARASASVALAVFCINALLFFDVVLAKRFLDGFGAGLYGAAALAGRALFAAVAFIPTVLLPHAAQRAAVGERTRWLFAQAFGVALAACVVVVIGYALFPQQVVTIIAGRSFAGAAPLLVPYIYAIAALSLANVIATYNIARGRMRFVPLLVCITIGEVVAVMVRHRSAADLLQTIDVGHTLALVACASSLGGRRGRARRTEAG